MLSKLKDILRKIAKYHRENSIFYLISVIHIAKYFLLKNYRKTRCLIDPTTEFFYKYRKFANYFSIPLLILGKYFERKKIFISVNNEWNFSVGHFYSETDLAKRMQKLVDKYSGSQIWFTTSRKDILGETLYAFRSENFNILIGGIKRLVLTFVAIKYPAISIDASIGKEDYIFGTTSLDSSAVYDDKSRQRARLISNSPEFYPNKDKLGHYHNQKLKLMRNLNISDKYIVIQIKTQKGNGTFRPASPELYLESIKYFQDKGYEIVLAGREMCPRIFLDNNVINYAGSKYASALNDFLLIGHCSLVIASASGFCMIAENLDKPILTINSIHLIQHFGRRTILLPTLLSRRKELFNARIQHQYLCKYGPDCGHQTFDDLYILHMVTSQEILEGAKELEEMLSSYVPSYTSLQEKIRNNGGCPLLSDGLSRISDYYLSKHGYFFDK